MKKVLFYLFISFLIIIDFIVILGFSALVFNGDPTIIAGIIGFIGAIIGGFITYFGVNKTIKHRDRELFLKDAVERLASLDYLISIFEVHLNNAFLYENALREKGMVNETALVLITNFYGDLIKNKETTYKNMTFDEVEIIEFHIKTIRHFTLKKKLTDGEIGKCIDIIRTVFQVFYTSKENLRSKYYKYSRGKL